MRRLGMRKEAHFKKSFWTGKEWVDDVIYMPMSRGEPEVLFLGKR